MRRQVRIVLAMSACLSFVIGLGCGCSRQGTEQETEEDQVPAEEVSQPAESTGEQGDARVEEAAPPSPPTTE